MRLIKDQEVVKQFTSECTLPKRQDHPGRSASKPDMKVYLHPAPYLTGCYHQYLTAFSLKLFYCHDNDDAIVEDLQPHLFHLYSVE